MKLIPLRKEKELMPSWSLFDDFIEKFFNDDFSENSRLMAVDVIENDHEFTVKANLPGISKDKINISIKNNQLVISANQEYNKEDKENGTIIRSERFSGSYQRSINLPDVCDHDNIKAKMENGVLILNIPKKEPTPKKEIIIQ